MFPCVFFFFFKSYLQLFYHFNIIAFYVQSFKYFIYALPSYYFNTISFTKQDYRRDKIKTHND